MGPIPTTHFFWYNNEIYIPVNPSANLPYTKEDYQQMAISGYRLSSVGQELFHITKREDLPEYHKEIFDFLEEYYDVKMYRFEVPPEIQGIL